VAPKKEFEPMEQRKKALGIIQYQGDTKGSKKKPMKEKTSGGVGGGKH